MYKVVLYKHIFSNTFYILYQNLSFSRNGKNYNVFLFSMYGLTYLHSNVHKIVSDALH